MVYAVGRYRGRIEHVAGLDNVGDVQPWERDRAVVSVSGVEREIRPVRRVRQIVEESRHCPSMIEPSPAEPSEYAHWRL